MEEEVKGGEGSFFYPSKAGEERRNLFSLYFVAILGGVVDRELAELTPSLLGVCSLVPSQLPLPTSSSWEVQGHKDIIMDHLLY
jgi:hypothetical protein